MLSRGPTGMQAEHFKEWLDEARDAATAEKVAYKAAEATRGPEEERIEAERETGTKRELKNWEKVATLLRASFVKGKL